MKTITLLIAFILVSLISAKGNVTITSVTILPASPADTQHVHVVVESMFSSGGCPLINSTSSVMNDTVFLTAFYQPGPLAVICYSSDTFDVGILLCTIHGLSVTVMETGGPTGTDQSILPLTVTCTPTGITTINTKNHLDVFPNPASGELKVEFTGDNNSPSKISVQNILGETVYSAIDFQNEKAINIALLARGIYFVRVETKTGTIAKKFLKE